jgi:prepilin-type N-terminal cleavage/methylation domain-containing protein
MIQQLRKIARNQVGFTLIELMIALTITTIVTGACALIIFQVFNGEARANNQMDAISRVQNAGRQISLDASMAQSVSLTADEDGFPLTLAWTEWANNNRHQVIYSIENNTLKRVHIINGNLADSYIFEYIISIDPDTEELVTYCERDPATNQLIFTLTASAGVGSQRISETRVYQAIPRPGSL